MSEGLPNETRPTTITTSITSEFRESSERGPLDATVRALLPRRISDLALTIGGTPLEGCIEQLYAELESHGIAFKPKCYLADEWGCPTGVPVIGIPFYLADPQLTRIEGELSGLDPEGEPEIMMYLRHEAGHAFHYAYRLYLQSEWRELFGPFFKPYSDMYRPDPFSDRFVRHIPGWYAQKHPDEDAAETFAVWLTPGSNWLEVYAGTPALAKLLYIDRVAREYGLQPPLVTEGRTHGPVEELRTTLAEWYDTELDRSGDSLGLPLLLNADLRRLFPAGIGEPADEALAPYRGRMIREVRYWTGMDVSIVSTLVDEVFDRLQVLGLMSPPGQEASTLVGLSVLITTLTMNYHYTRQFVRR
jgi:hypothetical protein